MKVKTVTRYVGYRIVISALLVIVLLPLISVPVGASRPLTLEGRWNRLNPGTPPGHETLTCGGDEFWLCRYDVQPEPELGYVQPPNSIYGIFTGQDITSTWNCPGWFPEAACQDTTSVIEGEIKYYSPDNSYVFVIADLVVTDNDDQQVLYFYWRESTYGEFVCPWYRSFEAALAANPENVNSCYYP